MRSTQLFFPLTAVGGPRHGVASLRRATRRAAATSWPEGRWHHSCLHCATCLPASERAVHPTLKDDDEVTCRTFAARGNPCLHSKYRPVCSRDARCQEDITPPGQGETNFPVVGKSSSGTA